MNKKKTYITDYFLIVLGCIMVSVSTVWFADAANLVVGGVTGISLIVKDLSVKAFNWPVPLGLTNIVVNIPLFIIATKQRGFKFLRKSLIAVLLLSGVMFILEYLPNPFEKVTEDLLITSLCTGVLRGAGLGIIIRANATSGGSDMLGSIIKKRHPNVHIAMVILFIDCIIIISGGFLFGLTATLYAVIAIVVSSFVMNYIVVGIHFAIAVYIVSDKYEEISKRVIKETTRGVSALEIKGMYTGSTRNMLYIVVHRKQISQLIRIVKQIDDKCFMTVTDVRQVIGQGFETDVDTMGGY